MRLYCSLPLFVALATVSLIACTKEKPAPSASDKGADPALKAPAAPKAAGKLVDTLKFPEVGPMKVSAENPSTPEKVALGHRLFFDKRLSKDGSLSCYSCHQNEDGNGGRDPLAIGPEGKKLPRHSPVIWNVGYLEALYWDGRSPSLETQALAAWSGGNLGVGKEKLEAKAAELAALPEYKAAFAEAFPGKPADALAFAQALAAYERTLICADTAYDKYAAGNKSALSDVQKDGLELFMGKGMCTACHAPPFFSTAYLGAGTYFNVGVGTKDVPEADVDVGRMKVTSDAKDWAAFKPPSLRNVTKSAPYFHDGHQPELRKAVSFMASGGYDNKNKSPLMAPKNFTEPEIDQLVEFLKALECGAALTPPAPVAK